MITKSLLRAFSAGEMAPELYGRLDLSRYQTGLRLAENFQTLPHGPAQNRAGLKYTLHAKNRTKAAVLIPFEYSSTQSFMLEFGDLYIRFHSNGATVLETAKNITNITQGLPATVTSTAHGFLNGQWVFLTGIAGMTQLNGRFVKVSNKTTNTFEIQGLDGVDVNTTAYGMYVSGGTAARVYEIASPYTEASLPYIHYAQSAEVLTLVNSGFAPRELRITTPTSWALTTIAFATSQAAPTVGTGTDTATYVVTALATNGVEESIASGTGSATNDLTISGNYNTVTWTAAAGATRYNVFKDSNGIFGFIGQAIGTSFVDDNITADISQSPPENSNPFASDFPRAVGYFEGRRWFGGTVAKPQNLFGTKSATDSNMNFSTPTRDSDSIAIKIAARQVNTIQHIVPLSELLLLTSGAEFKVVGANTDVLTPSSISVKPQSYVGASTVQPITYNNSILFGQARGGRVRELRYSFDVNGYNVNDVSLLAPHLFDQYTIVSMAMTKAPISTAWFVRSDGVLLGFTYVPEQSVYGWHRHITDGAFESIAVIPEGNEDRLYAVVRRMVNGSSYRYIERLESRQFVTLEDCFFVDSGLTYDGSPAATIGGLWHLEGAMVSILADGAVHPAQLVMNGSVTLEEQASVVQVGLPYTARMQTLPLALEALALGQGTKRNVNRVYVRFDNTSGVFIGQDFDDMTQIKQRTDEPMGSPPRVISTEFEHIVSGDWDTDGGICIRQSDPLPVTVLSMTLEVAMGG